MIKVKRKCWRKIQRLQQKLMILERAIFNRTLLGKPARRQVTRDREKMAKKRQWTLGSCDDRTQLRLLLRRALEFTLIHDLIIAFPSKYQLRKGRLKIAAVFCQWTIKQVKKKTRLLSSIKAQVPKMKTKMITV